MVISFPLHCNVFLDAKIEPFCSIFSILQNVSKAKITKHCVKFVDVDF